MNTEFEVLWVQAKPSKTPLVPDAAGYGPFKIERCSEAEAPARLAGHAYAAVVLGTPTPLLDAGDAAVLHVHRGAPADDVLRWLSAGAQDVLTADELQLPSWPLRLRSAIERQRRLVTTRQAFATDVLTGLPHEQQLLEHMSHLLALREREPSPMALLVLRVEGLGTIQLRLGREAASVLRRKLAVRVRAALRASDVVASIRGDSFAVLLSSIETATDAELVGSKLLTALNDTFTISGQQVPVATALGVAHHPADGTQPAGLLARAIGLAASAQAVGRVGQASWVERGAAND